jgi:hypothetical protein
MKTRTLLIASLLITFNAAFAQPSGCVNDRYGNPQCPPPGGACLKNRLGEVRCSQADGGILLDRYQDAVCGPGQCIAGREH